MFRKLAIALLAIFVFTLPAFCEYPTMSFSNGGLGSSGGGSSEWTASGSTQIYTTKSVGIGTSTPEVDNVIDVYSKDGTRHLYMNNTKFRVEDPRYSYTYLELNSSGQLYTYSGYAGQAFYAPSFRFTNSLSYKCSIDADSNTNMNLRCPDSGAVQHTVLKLMGDTQNVLIGSTVDDGINRLQVTGDSKFNGDVKIKSASDINTPTLLLHNTKQTGIGVDDTSNKMTIFSDGNRMIQVNYPYVDFLLYTTFSQPLRAPNGSYGSPAYTAVYDTNSGMFFTGSDELGFSTGGIEAARFTASHTLNLSNTPVYADNTSALAGGLVAGDVYRTSTGVLMITY